MAINYSKKLLLEIVRESGKQCSFCKTFLKMRERNVCRDCPLSKRNLPNNLNGCADLRTRILKAYNNFETPIEYAVKRIREINSEEINIFSINDIISNILSKNVS